MKRAFARLLHRRSRWAMAVLGAVVAAVVIIPGALVVAYETRSPCSDAYRGGQWEQAIASCRAGYERDANKHDLFLLAKTFYKLQQDNELIGIAPLLLAGEYAAEIHFELAYVFAISKKLPTEGRLHLAQAFATHVAYRDREALLKDLAAWAAIERYGTNYEAALGLGQQAVRLATALGDVKTTVTANLALADAAFEMGAYKLAEQALRVVEAHQAVLSPDDKIEFELKLGEMWAAESDSGMDRLEDALSAFRIAERELDDRPIKPWGTRSQILLNEAAILSLRDLDAASALLDKFDVVEKGVASSSLRRASIAAQRGELVEAAKYLQQAEAHSVHADDMPLQVARARGNLAELMRDPIEAEAQYRRAIGIVAGNRRESRAESGFILAGHRGAYDDLIHLLASKQQWTQVLEVILSMDVSDMLHADYETRLPGRSVARSEGEAPNVRDVIAAWRGRDLVIVIAPVRRSLGPDPNLAYRVRVHDGVVTGEPIGDAQALRSMVDKTGGKTDTELAAWAKRIVPEDARAEPLSVLLVGPLSALPLSTLSGVADPAMAAPRTLVRVQSLLTRTVSAHSTGGIAIFADSDPQMPLPAARVEADTVASAVRTGAEVYKSREATFEQLVRHRDAEVLHIATHVMAEGGQHTIHLANRDVNQMDIVNHGIAPHLVVLSGCGSAVAGDAEGWQTVAAAFLEAGATYVVATAYNIEDAAAPILMAEFYRQPDVLDDPAHALAVAQRNVIAHATPEQLTQYLRSWLAYSVLARPPVVPAKT